MTQTTAFDPDVRTDFMEDYDKHKAERDERDAKAIAKAAEEPAVVPDLGPPPPPLKEGEDMNDLVVAREGTLLEMLQRTGAPKEDGEWGCYNVWKPGALTLVLGTQQSFKSWGMFDLMLHAAQGSDWLGHALADFDSIVYVSNEKSQQAVYERLWTVFDGHKHEANKVYVRHRGDRIHFGNEAWKDLVTFLKEDLAEQRVLLILDTLTSLAPPGYDENSLTHVSVVLEAIRDVQDESRIDVMLVHHLNAMGERPRGHTSLDGEVDGFVRFNRRGRDVDEVLVTFEPKDGMSSTGAFRFQPHSGTFHRAQSRALHVGNLREIVRWWEERNQGEGITIKELRDKFYTAHRYDAIEKQVDRAVKELVLKRETRRSMLTNREASLINTLSEQEREIIVSRREAAADVEAEVEARYNAEAAVVRKAEQARAYMPPDDEDDEIGTLLG